jgi:aspartate ammonia-lyase
MRYDAATSIARRALPSGQSVTSLVLESGLLTACELDEILRPERLAHPQSRTGDTFSCSCSDEA